MKKTITSICMIATFIVLSACGKPIATEGTSSSTTTPVASTDSASTATRTITYLDKSYTIPAKAERIVITGSLEAMEDSILLDIHPVGAISVSGKFPPLFASITDQAESIGEKIDPNFEKILSLKPDVILGTTKFDPAILEKLQQIAPTIPYSHVATNWEENLTLLGEISGKQKQAAQEITAYKANLEKAKTTLQSTLKDKQVLLVRMREGAVCLYGPDLYFNPVLYSDLGLAIPAEVAAAKSQEAISIEQFAQMNPDVLFIQFSEDENPDATGALEDLQNNPIFQSIQAVKDGNVFVNVVDPLAQGGTAYSKIQFLQAFVDTLQSK
ncbi:ABC transporter substrate-binding protein [Paenibacillus sp. PsM32]|uniref:ABC transporter substrate-binding protein n=1 Tax=Paenibacillus sp. PsM32 TaxID=3030536 RepID=UPI00263A804E|nr:ABC transporter substrate-binding protein [Paenibacillus sp. PsM32]MDN4617037.1 ABC transporter substrate-binding protein [Paenibacillus sp. PsM32]